LSESARSRTAKKRVNVVAARMLLEGKPVEEVERATGLRMFDVEGMKGWLQSEAGKKWAVQKGLVKPPCQVKRVYMDEAGREHVVAEGSCQEDLGMLRLFGVVIESEDQARDELAEDRTKIERARAEIEETRRRIEEDIRRNQEFERDMAEIAQLEAELLGTQQRRKRAYDLIY